MPYTVKKQGDEWCVIKDADGESMGCHDSEAKAEAQVAALYASEEKADKAETPPPDEEEPEASAGSADPEAETDTQEVATVAKLDVPSNIRTLTLNIQAAVSEAVAKAFGRKDDTQTAFKVVGNHWFIVWSNNFKDRDGEIFTEKAIDDYIQRVDMGVVPLPELWVWHIPGTRIGQAEWVDRHGHFVVAGGSFDDTPDGRAGRAYYSKHAHEKGISHGYQFPVSRFDGKHYHAFNSFEFTPLPLGAEANLYTSFEGVKEAKMNEKKQAELEAVFGKERAAEILANLDQRGKALEALEVEYKDFAGEDLQAAANKEAVDRAEKSFAELVSELLESSSEPITAAREAVKVAKASTATVAELRKEIDALRAEMELAPRRSSKDKRTLVAESDPLFQQSQLGVDEGLKEALPGLFREA